MAEFPSESHSSRHELTNKRSRNGRLLACEPCRIRKLRCDHSVPVCNRCRRSKLPRTCVYPEGSGIAISPDVPTTNSRTAHDALDESTTPNDRISIQTGFLGATSLSRMLSDADHIVVQSLRDPENTSDQFHATRASGRAEIMQKAPSRQPLDVALKVIKSIPDPSTARLLMEGNTSPVDGWPRPALMQMADSLFETFEPHTSTKEKRAPQINMARTLSDNSNWALEEGMNDAQDWLASFTGRNFRWEGLGILFAHWAVGAFHLHGGSQNTRERSLSHELMTSVDACLQLVNWTCGGNLLLVYLLQRHAHLTTLHLGDANLITELILGHAIAVAMSVGLHVGPRTPAQSTSLPSQLRSRLFAHLNIWDKVSAIVTGRPPRLHRRYCSTPLPLDLSDEALLQLGENSTPAGADLNVDQAGWNINNAIYNTTLMRARALLADMREAILELALGPEDMVNAEELRRLKDREESLYSSLPSVLSYDPDNHFLRNSDRRASSSKTLVRLEHLQNLFFICRLLSRSDNLLQNSQDLIRTSYDMLLATLAIWTVDSNSPLKGSIDWLVVSYACPAAGILCNALLQTGHWQVSTERPGYPLRSEVVQQLSLLCGLMTFLGPDAPNASLWTAVKDIIDRVLKHILDTPPDDQFRLQVNNNTCVGLEFPSEAWLSAEFQETFPFDLLDTFDWARVEDA